MEDEVLLRGSDTKVVGFFPKSWHLKIPCGIFDGCVTAKFFYECDCDGSEMRYTGQPVVCDYSTDLQGTVTCQKMLQCTKQRHQTVGK